jgi:hypothetical protein
MYVEASRSLSGFDAHVRGAQGILLAASVEGQPDVASKPQDVG